MGRGERRPWPAGRSRAGGPPTRGATGGATRTRLLVGGLAGLLVVAYGAYLVSRPLVERRLRAQLQRAAAARGFSATIGSVHLTPSLTLELREVLIEDRRVQIATRVLDLRPRLSPRGLIGRAANASVGAVVVILPAGVQVDVAPSSWSLELPARGLHLARKAGGGRLDLRFARSHAGSVIDARASQAALSGLVRVLLRGCPILDPGTLDGEAHVEQEKDVVRAVVKGRASGLAVGSLGEPGGSDCHAAGFGAPTDVRLDTNATIRPREGSLVADRVLVVAGAVDGVGRLRVDGGLRDPKVDLAFEVARVDFARLLATAGLDLAAEDLGSAALSGHVSGRLRAPSRLVVTQHLDFTPPPRVPRALTRLAGPFVHHATSRSGRKTTILVSPDSSDYIPLAEVPPLFLRALLIAEDASFYNHQGIDLSELPAALAINFARGAFVRGASTISQQLAKNLFLSRTKTLGRKLEEASLALLLDSALGKRRILEIYLNVIEWGPGIYGLRPAARHYFGKEPEQLTPKQMVFLVSLVPGPVKYQASIATGTPTPFFEGLMTTLLGKLGAVGALGEAEYLAALSEPLGLLVTEEPADGTAVPDATDPPAAPDAPLVPDLQEAIPPDAAPPAAPPPSVEPAEPVGAVAAPKLQGGAESRVAVDAIRTSH